MAFWSFRFFDSRSFFGTFAARFESIPAAEERFFMIAQRF